MSKRKAKALGWRWGVIDSLQCDILGPCVVDCDWLLIPLYTIAALVLVDERMMKLDLGVPSP